MLPIDFDVEEYRQYNPDIAKFSDEWLRSHYVKCGSIQNRIYKLSLPEDFDVNAYRELNSDIAKYPDEWLERHYQVHGRKEGRVYSSNNQQLSWNSNMLSNIERVHNWCSSSLSKTDHSNTIDNTSTKAIVVFSTSDRNYLSPSKREHLQQVATRWGSELLIFTDPKELLSEVRIEICKAFKSFRECVVNYVCKLMCIHTALAKYDRVVWLDDTCVISPFAPSLFDVVPGNSIGALVIPRACGLTESASDYKYLLDNRNVEIDDEYYNTGVMVVPSIHKDLFSFETIVGHRDLLQSPYPTQALLNFLTHVSQCDIFDITTMYNMMPCCYNYDNRLCQTSDISSIYPELLRYYIVHFTGFHRNREKFHNEFFQLQESYNEKITIIIMNFKRPDNIKNFILPYYDKISVIDQVILVHCLEDTAFEYSSPKVKHVYEYDTNVEYGVFTRYIAAKKYAATKCILFTDDDVVIPIKTIATIYYKWNTNPNRVIGAEGRKLYKKENKDVYEYKSTPHYGEVDFVLTSCCMTSIDHVSYVCSQEHIMRDYANTTSIKWNGEDIYLGLLSTLKHNINCLALNSPVVLLQDTSHAISGVSTHFIERSVLINLFFERFGS